MLYIYKSISHLKFVGWALFLTVLMALVLQLRTTRAAFPLPRPNGELSIKLVPVGMVPAQTKSTDLEFTSDGRFFVVSKEGRIFIVEPDGTLLETPFIDISGKVARDGLEQGLLGLAFHPDYESNGYFYISYSSSELDGATVISRFSVSDSDPNLANADSEQILLTIEQPTQTHHGGDLAFGPDNYFYISVGDGGVWEDAENYAQNGSLLLGKILRIDVDNPANGQAYGIPPDNPFVDDPQVRDEIWALGLRNPWRFSFDRLTGDMYVSDVGQLRWEEINFEPADSAGGLNYGWSCYESNEPFDQTHCSEGSVYTFPVAEYFHDTGSAAVTGGFVYRGSQYPAIEGLYIFSDIITGQLYGLQRDSEDNWIMSDLTSPTISTATFAEAPDGELYLVSYTDDTIYQIQVEGVTTATPTQILTPSPTQILTASPTQILTASPTQILTASPTQTLTPTISPTPTSSILSPTPTASATQTPTSKPSHLYLPLITRE